MIDKFYLPILKSKDGEFNALRRLKGRERDLMAPIFEITPVEWDNVEKEKPKTLDAHLEKFAIRFAKKWGSSDCFVDTALLNWEGTDNTPKIEMVFDLLAKKKLVPNPIIYLTSTDLFKKALITIVNRYGISDIGIRITPDDVSSADFQEEIGKLLAEVKFSTEKCHIILDLKDSKFSEVENIADMALGIIEIFPYLDKWKSFSVAGTSFPKSSAIDIGLKEFSRDEWKFYRLLVEKLKKESFKRHINYGDYSIVSPEYFEFNPKIMKASANIRYTHDETWIVSKGRKLAKKVDFKQYTQLAEAIYKTKYYLGEDFSEGDLHLAKCIRGETKTPGAPSTWLWVGNNHHFTKVLKDLTAIGFFA